MVGRPWKELSFVWAVLLIQRWEPESGEELICMAATVRRPLEEELMGLVLIT